MPCGAKEAHLLFVNCSFSLSCCNNLTLADSNFLSNLQFYRKYERHKIWGVYEFLSPALIVADPDLLKYFLVKDFEHFVDRRVVGDQPGSIMSNVLSNKRGDDWKDLRSLMSPTFSTGKMRGMYHLVCEKVHSLVSFCLKNAANNRPVDMKDMFNRYSMDTIASCAFGIDCNSFSDSKPIFAEKAEAFFRIEGLRKMKFTFMVTMPKLYNALGLRADTPEMEFFAKVSREATVARQKGRQRRGDFLDIMLEAQDAEDGLHSGKRGNYYVQVYPLRREVKESVLERHAKD